MKLVLLGLALTATVATSAFAGEGMGPNSWPPAATPSADVKPLTRAEVKGELVKAEQDGTLAADNRADYPAAHISSASSGKARAEVQADAKLATNAEVAATYRGN
jgi:hypothetical protein